MPFGTRIEIIQIEFYSVARNKISYYKFELILTDIQKFFFIKILSRCFFLISVPDLKYGPKT